MHKQSTLIAVTLAATLCFFSVPTVSAGQRPVVIKLATLAPEGTLFYDALLKLAGEWSRLSGGAVRLKIYPGGVAGSEYDMVRKLRIGQIQAATI